MPERQRPPLPPSTVARLAVYQRHLLRLAAAQELTISSERLGQVAGVTAAQVRKDLSCLGALGTRGIGYDVEYLLYRAGRELGLGEDSPIVIVGMGHLGRALANYDGFARQGFRILALFDSDPGKVGEPFAGLLVRHVDEIQGAVAGPAIGVITTPVPAAQDAADRLVAAGVDAILNFAPSLLAVPGNVCIRNVDVSVELQILSYYRVSADGLGRATSASTPADRLTLLRRRPSP